MPPLLQSILEQTQTPGEVLIVDGGSTDLTRDIVREFEGKCPLVLVLHAGGNIAQCRNLGIKMASGNIIAITDAGCRLENRWLEKITEPICNTSSAKIVAGIYLPLFDNEFGEIASYLVFPPIDALKASKFLPSGRSLALRKDVWLRAGGFPEWLDYAEDTYFDLKVRELGIDFFLQKDAIVYWMVRKSPIEIFRQFHRYGTGDGQAHLFITTYLAKISVTATAAACLAAAFAFENIVFLAALPISVVVVWNVHLKKVKRASPRRVLIAFLIVLSIEGGLMTGFIRGLLRGRPTRT